MATGNRWLRVTGASLALLSVAPLLAWVYGVGRFASWYWRLTLPALVALVALSMFVVARRRDGEIHLALLAGTAGGLLGTLLYDAVRAPFTLFGLRLLVPIDSYGVLMLDAAGSSARTGLAGWVFHTTNGVCFSIAYALVASGRSRWWAVAWAMVLESVAVFSPFAPYYALDGDWGLIAFTYLAHVPYGLAIGVCCENPRRTAAALREMSPRAPGAVMLAVTATALVLWHQPWHTTARVQAGERVAPGPSAVIVNDRFAPEWIHVAAGECAVLRNDDREVHLVQQQRIEPGATSTLCLDGDGVHRVKTGGAYSGGFVIVDPQATPSSAAGG